MMKNVMLDFSQIFSNQTAVFSSRANLDNEPVIVLSTDFIPKTIFWVLESRLIHWLHILDPGESDGCITGCAIAWVSPQSSHANTQLRATMTVTLSAELMPSLAITLMMMFVISRVIPKFSSRCQ